MPRFRNFILGARHGRSLMMTLGVKRFRIVDGVEPIALYYKVVVESFEDEMLSRATSSS